MIAPSSNNIIYEAVSYAQEKKNNRETGQKNINLKRLQGRSPCILVLYANEYSV